MATVTSKRADDIVGRCLAMASDMLRLPSRHIWLDYDEEADVLYLMVDVRNIQYLLHERGYSPDQIIQALHATAHALIR